MRMSKEDFEHARTLFEGVMGKKLISHAETLELELKISKEDEQEAVANYGQAVKHVDRLTENVAQLTKENRRLMAEVDEAREAKKVALLQKHIDAIEWARKVGTKNSNVIKRYVNKGEYEGTNTSLLREIPLDTLLLALVNGYTVEQTKEERLREGLEPIIKEWWNTKQEAGTMTTNLARIVTDFVTKFNAENG